MFLYDRYFREFGIRKVGDLTRTHRYTDMTELPADSVLHIGRAYLKDPSPETIPVPPHVAFSHYAGDRRTLIHFNRHSDKDGNNVLERDPAIKEKYEDIASQIRAYRSKSIKVVSSPDQFSSDAVQYLNVQSYEPMFCCKVTGYMERHRAILQMFDHLIKNVEMDAKHHFLMVPIPEFSYKPTAFVKTFKKHASTTITAKSGWLVSIMQPRDINLWTLR